MKTTPEALKALYQTLGGSSGNVAGESKTTGILNKIAALFGSTATADKIPDAIDNINAVASGVTKPDGKITITENATDINVAQYATADVNVSGGGSSDFSTATVTIVSIDDGEGFGIDFPIVPDSASLGELTEGVYFGFRFAEGAHICKVPLNNGKCFGLTPFNCTLSGNIADDGEGNLTITGDGTITQTS